MLKLMKRILKDDGFTLIEVMIVVIILTILGGIALISFGGLQQQAQTARVQADFRVIATALMGFKAMTGAWPTTVQGLAILPTNVGTYQALINSIPNDPFTTPPAPYGYVIPDPTNPLAVDITSANGAIMVVQ